VLGNAQEPKRRFIPSKWEAKKIIKLVHSIRNGWLKLEKEEEPEETYAHTPLFSLCVSPFTVLHHVNSAHLSHDKSVLIMTRIRYLIWRDDEEIDKKRNKMPVAIPPPKMHLPGHGESYNPPPEYLPTEEEREAWDDMDPEDRPANFLPQQFTALRDVPAYDKFMQERFERYLYSINSITIIVITVIIFIIIITIIIIIIIITIIIIIIIIIIKHHNCRCLDLYLCPRVRRKRLNIDPKSLIPVRNSISIAPNSIAQHLSTISLPSLYHLYHLSNISLTSL
jgi:ribosome biogenesis protein ERB1